MNSDPNNLNDAYLSDVSWRQSSGERFEYLQIGEDLQMKEFFYSERYEVWDRLFPVKQLPIDY